MSKWVLVVLVVLAGRPAVAAPAHGALLEVGRRWTYAVVAGEAGAPTGAIVTLTVKTVEKHGAYTAIALAAQTANGPKEDELLTGLALIAGPSGLREVLNIDDLRDTKALRDAYEHKYLPRIYLPASLKKQQLKRSLERFGEDDRVYKVTGALSQPAPHTWRMAWKGSYVVPEVAEDGATKYQFITELDPAVGLTLICPGDDAKRCLRLQP